MVEFRMPSLGADMEAGTLVAYRCEPGSRVERGGIIAEIETDKGVIEVESYVSGVLDRWLVPLGGKVPVGTPLAILRDESTPPRTAAQGMPAVAVSAPPTGAVLGPPAAATPEPLVASHPPPAEAVLGALAAATPESLVASHAPPAEAAFGPLAAATPEPLVASHAPPAEAAARLAPLTAAAPSAQAPASEQPMAARATPSARKRARELGVDLSQLALNRPLTVADVDRAAVSHAAPAEPRASRTARLRISPAAAKRARELGIDLHRFDSTDAPIQLQDVEQLARKSATQQTPAPVNDLLVGPRRVIAAAMARAKREIPHYYLSTSVDLAAASRWLEVHNSERSVHERLLLGVLFLRAVALATQRMPDFNVRWAEAGPERQPDVHLGVAISLRGGGLVSPAILRAPALSLSELMKAFQDLVSRARSGRLRSSELGSGTITVTSLGERGVDAVFPIIHPPQSAIVGFGRSALRPWVSDGALCVRPLVQVTLAADHRITDGHAGARYLALVEQLLQDPERL